METGKVPRNTVQRDGEAGGVATTRNGSIDTEVVYHDRVAGWPRCTGH